MVHVMEVLDAAIRGAPAEELLRRRGDGRGRPVA
jgi:hypothetical protein